MGHEIADRDRPLGDALQHQRAQPETARVVSHPAGLERGVLAVVGEHQQPATLGAVNDILGQYVHVCYRHRAHWTGWFAPSARPFAARGAAAQTARELPRALLFGRHREERDERWTTMEEEKRLGRLPLEGRAAVIDCVTLWITNIFSDSRPASLGSGAAGSGSGPGAGGSGSGSRAVGPGAAGLGYDVDGCFASCKAEIDALLEREAYLIVISNEIGMGLHAETETGRKFTDLQGWVNQYLAARADEVIFMISGIPLTVK